MIALPVLLGSICAYQLPAPLSVLMAALMLVACVPALLSPLHNPLHTEEG